MDDVVIRIENLSKRYQIGERKPYLALRDVLARAMSAPARIFRPRKPSSSNGDASHIWALKDVSFEVRQGEIVGIVGRNGAGKSTLLKILARVTKPTNGFAQVRGRMGSLLEVGTGFHPELTGRENVYLSGAILGMRKGEIDRKFDEIVAFAELEKFIDTPVKHYSSGMYVRLAFAVAAHLEPQVLIVDEVLAVGDYQFQEKCLRRMDEVGRSGRTILLVSHNVTAISNACDRCILLKEGRIAEDGPTAGVVAEYLSDIGACGGEVEWLSPQVAPGNERVRLRSVRILADGGDGQPTDLVDIQKDIEVRVDFWNLKPGSALSVSIHLKDSTGTCVLASANFPSANVAPDPWFGRAYPAGCFRTTCIIPGNFLNEGRYRVTAIVLTHVTNVEIVVHDAVSFSVYETGGMRAEFTGHWIGVVRPRLAWRTEPLDHIDNTEPDLAARSARCTS